LKRFQDKFGFVIDLIVKCKKFFIYDNIEQVLCHFTAMPVPLFNNPSKS